MIIDNFDDEEKTLSELQSEPAYKELIETSGLKILFTTRSCPNDKTNELMPFDEETALKLFKSISPVEDADLKIVCELIREVECHPMMVEMLAKYSRRFMARYSLQGTFDKIQIRKN